MTTDHPITPPPELVQQWRAAASNVPATLSTDSGGRHDYIDFIATRAAQWGADQEVSACCQWLVLNGYDLVASKFRFARRPKPPSLKQRALKGLDTMIANGHLDAELAAAIREVLEASHD
jgi:hypothetical protein